MNVYLLANAFLERDSHDRSYWPMIAEVYCNDLKTIRQDDALQWLGTGFATAYILAYGATKNEVQLQLQSSPPLNDIRVILSRMPTPAEALSWLLREMADVEAGVHSMPNKEREQLLAWFSQNVDAQPLPWAGRQPVQRTFAGGSSAALLPATFAQNSLWVAPRTLEDEYLLDSQTSTPPKSPPHQPSYSPTKRILPWMTRRASAPRSSASSPSSLPDSFSEDNLYAEEASRTADSPYFRRHPLVRNVIIIDD